MPNFKKGFTLIELLVVIAIIGLLASIVLVSLNSVRGNARDAKRASDVNQIRLAVELVRDANYGVPPDTAGVVYCLGISSCWSDVIGSSAVDTALQPYLSTIPTDPLDERIYNAYVYRSPGKYWLPSPINFVQGGPTSYSIAWKPDVPDNSNPTEAQCKAMGGTWAAWDNSPGATHCPSGGSCRQCGMLVE